MQNGKQSLYTSKYFVVIGILLLVLLFNQVEIWKERAPKIDASVVFDGAATSGTTNIQATIIASPPSINIIYPQNITIERNQSIGVLVRVENSSSLSIDEVFYNIDDTANNSLISVGQDIYTSILSTEEGSHTLNVFANNTANEQNNISLMFNINNNLNFEVNWSRFIGAGTNLSLFNQSELENISNFTLEVPSFGRIQFRESINLTDDNLSDSPIDLDSFIEINGSIIINDSILTNLAGRAATIYFFNVTYTNVTVLRNDEVCPVAICSSIVLAGQTLSVDVTGFSQYDVQDGGSGGESGSGSGSGAGGSLGGGGGSKDGTSASASFNMNQFMEQTNTVARIGKIYILWGKEEYSARIGKPSPDMMLLDFTALGIKVSLRKGESVSLDLDFDEEEDIKILLENVDKNTAVLTITALQREVVKEVIEKVPEEPRKETAQEKNREKITKSFLNKDLWGVILLLILATGFVIYQYKENEFKRHKQRKRF